VNTCLSHMLHRKQRQQHRWTARDFIMTVILVICTYWQHKDTCQSVPRSIALINATGCSCYYVRNLYLIRLMYNWRPA
jgi:hypothetical protein